METKQFTSEFVREKGKLYNSTEMNHDLNFHIYDI